MIPRILMVDNYDSFTYNLVQGFMGLGAEVTVRCNDEIEPADVAVFEPTHLVVSPGPGRPEAAGSSMRIIESLVGSIPILGVCLGHQAIAAVFEGSVGYARHLMHGKSSDVYHDGRTVYQDMSMPFVAGRYHSLAVSADDFPSELVVTARTLDGEIMGIRHTSLPIEGVQFHPESVLTPDGVALMSNFLSLSREPSPTPELVV